MSDENELLETAEPFELEFFHCVVCGEPIPNSRVIRKAVTCCEEHATVLKNARRRVRDNSKCRLCNRPATPEEIASWRRWRREAYGETRGRKAAPKSEDAPQDDQPALANIEEKEEAQA